MITIAPTFIQQFFDNNGKPLSQGKLFTYFAGTNTNAKTYTDSTGISENSNPIILDGSGRCNIWLDTSISYKFILKDKNDIVIKTVDNVSPVGASNGSSSPYENFYVVKNFEELKSAYLDGWQSKIIFLTTPIEISEPCITKGQIRHYGDEVTINVGSFSTSNDLYFYNNVRLSTNTLNTTINCKIYFRKLKSSSSLIATTNTNIFYEEYIGSGDISAFEQKYWDNTIDSSNFLDKYLNNFPKGDDGQVLKMVSGDVRWDDESVYTPQPDSIGLTELKDEVTENFVPYVGADKDVDLGENTLYVDTIGKSSSATLGDAILVKDNILLDPPAPGFPSKQIFFTGGQEPLYINVPDSIDNPGVFIGKVGRGYHLGVSGIDYGSDPYNTLSSNKRIFFPQPPILNRIAIPQASLITAESGYTVSEYESYMMPDGLLVLRFKIDKNSGDIPNNTSMAVIDTKFRPNVTVYRGVAYAVKASDYTPACFFISKDTGTIKLVGSPVCTSVYLEVSYPIDIMTQVQ